MGLGAQSCSCHRPVIPPTSAAFLGPPRSSCLPQLEQPPLLPGARGSGTERRRGASGGTETPKAKGTPQLFPPPRRPRRLETAREAARRQHGSFTPKTRSAAGAAPLLPLLSTPPRVTGQRTRRTRAGTQLYVLDTPVAPGHSDIPRHVTSWVRAEPPRNPKLCRVSELLSSPLLNPVGLWARPRTHTWAHALPSHAGDAPARPGGRREALHQTTAATLNHSYFQSGKRGNPCPALLPGAAQLCPGKRHVAPDLGGQEPSAGALCPPGRAAPLLPAGLCFPFLLRPKPGTNEQLPAPQTLVPLLGCKRRRWSQGTSSAACLRDRRL